MLSSIPGEKFLFSTITLCLLSNGVFAQTEKIADKEAAAAPPAIYELPSEINDFDQLIAFVEEIDGMEPSEDNQVAMEAHHRKAARTIVAAAQKLSTKELSDEHAMEVVFLRLRGLQILQRLSDPKAGERLSKEVDKALADERSDVQAVGVKFMIESGFLQWSVWSDEEKNALIDKASKYFSSRPAEANHVDTIIKMVDFLGEVNGHDGAKRLMSDLIPHFKKSDDPQIQQLLVVLEGVNRRVQLPGNEIKLEGTLLDGSKLDWQSYRGKVVLVDFWATWCGPCRAEVPNILKMYEAYHDKGFEVLGISLDETSEQAESYIKDTNIPWPTMFSKAAAERGWRHPMAVRYGVTGIPLAILVNREGKVVHMLARGPYLEQELRRMLGEPVARAGAAASSEIQRVNFSFNE